MARVGERERERDERENTEKRIHSLTHSMKQGTLHTYVTQWTPELKRQSAPSPAPLSFSLFLCMRVAHGRCYLANKSTFHMEPMNASCESDSLPFISSLLLFTQRLMYFHASLHQATCASLSFCLPLSLSLSLPPCPPISGERCRGTKLFICHVTVLCFTWRERKKKSHHQVKCTRELTFFSRANRFLARLSFLPSDDSILLSSPLFFTTYFSLLSLACAHSSLINRHWWVSSLSPFLSCRLCDGDQLIYTVNVLLLVLTLSLLTISVDFS